MSDIETTRANAEEENDFEADQNLLGFFELLLKVDRRINPHLYKAEPEKINNPNLNA